MTKNKHLSRLCLKNSSSRIFIRFLITYLVLVLIPMLTLGGLIYGFYFNYMRNDLEKNCYASLQKIQDTHDQFLSQLNSLAEQMYLSGSFSQFSLASSPEKAAALVAELAVLQASNHDISDIALHFKGDPYLYTGSSSYTVSMFFEQAMKSSAYTEETVSRLLTSSQVSILPSHSINGYHRMGDFVAYSYPIPMQSKTPYATILYYIPASFYKNLFSGAEQERSNSYIVRDGTIIVSDCHLDISEAILSDMMSDDYSTKYLQYRDEKYLALHAREQYSDIDYYRLVNLNEVYQPLHRAQISFLLINALLLLICGLLMFLFSRMNYNPLKRLVHTLQSSSSGQSLSSNCGFSELLDGIEYVYHQNKQLNLKLAQSTRAKQSVLLINFIKGRFHSKDSMIPFCKEADFKIDQNFFAIFLVQFSVSSSIHPIDEETEALFNHASERLDMYSTELLTSDTLAVVAFFDSESTFSDAMDTIRHSLNAQGFAGFLGVSTPYSDIANSSKAFIEASTALTYHRIHREQEIIYFRDIKEEDSSSSLYPHSLLEEYNKAVASENYEKTVHTVNRISQFIRETSLPHFFTQCILKDLSEALIRLCIRHQYDRLDLYDLYNRVYSVHSLNALDDYCENLLDIYRALYTQSKQEPLSDDTNLLNIIQYINATCKSPNFSLYNVAEHFHLSPSQLTNSFKAQLHISPSVYVTNYRMRMAKHLLVHSDKGIADICMELGYNDTSSFIRKFKSYVGTTPAVYRKDHREETD